MPELLMTVRTNETTGHNPAQTNPWEEPPSLSSIIKANSPEYVPCPYDSVNTPNTCAEQRTPISDAAALATGLALSYDSSQRQAYEPAAPRSDEAYQQERAKLRELAAELVARIWLRGARQTLAAEGQNHQQRADSWIGGINRELGGEGTTAHQNMPQPKQSNPAYPRQHDPRQTRPANEYASGSDVISPWFTPSNTGQVPAASDRHASMPPVPRPRPASPDSALSPRLQDAQQPGPQEAPRRGRKLNFKSPVSPDDPRWYAPLQETSWEAFERLLREIPLAGDEPRPQPRPRRPATPPVISPEGLDVPKANPPATEVPAASAITEPPKTGLRRMLRSLFRRKANTNTPGRQRD